MGDTMAHTIEVYEQINGVWRTNRYNLSTKDAAKYLTRNPYAWPGGYPMFAITDDGGVLCPKCCKSEYYEIAHSTGSDGWSIVGIDINYEDNNLYCDHCGNQIESAYGD
jgi:hypothetical protein